MILVLKGADFSADNLGKVQVTTELHPFTKSAIQASGNTTLTSEQKSALDALFLAMGVDGSNNVMSKMRYMYLPILCNDVTKSLVNYASVDFNVDKVLDPNQWELRNHGLVGKNNSSTDAITLDLASDKALFGDNFTEMFLRTEPYANDANNLSNITGVVRSGDFIGAREDVNIYGIYSASTYGYSDIGTSIKPSGVVQANGYSIRGTTDNDWRLEGNVYKDKTVTIESLTHGQNETVYIFGLETKNTENPYGALIMGEGITSEQFHNIMDRLDDLYKSFL